MRSATGFTTRSDIGPGMIGGSDGLPDVKDKDEAINKEREENTARDSDNEDDSGLLAGGPYEADDAEADQIYAEVDRKMDERRKKRRCVGARVRC